MQKIYYLLLLLLLLFELLTDRHTLIYITSNFEKKKGKRKGKKKGKRKGKKKQRRTKTISLKNA